MAAHPQTVDWQEQWELHAPGFAQGKLPLPGLFPLFLEAGPGFGDLSHPTTQLMYSSLSEYVKGKVVLDIGCGSGILSIAALGYGASFVYGIDIEPEAIEHAKRNAHLNGLSDRSWFGTAACCPLKEPVVGLMNMIRTEQEAAWASIKMLHPYVTTLLTSGILKEEQDMYMEERLKWGFVCQKIKKKGKWLKNLFVKDA